MDRPVLESVRIRTPHDDFCDPDWLGKFTDSPPTGSVPRGYAFRRRNAGCREYKYFLAGSSIDAERKTLSRLGYSRQVAEETARAWARENWQRMEALARDEWHFMGIQAEALVVCRNVEQAIASPGCWGVESDGSQEYLSEIMLEELWELRHQLACFQVDITRFDDLATKAVVAAVRDLGHAEVSVRPPWSAGAGKPCGRRSP